MAAQLNVAGIVPPLYLPAGAAAARWGLWRAGQGWTQLSWLALGGALLVLGVNSYSALRAPLTNKHQKAS
jgi:hypothetical protein